MKISTSTFRLRSFSVLIAGVLLIVTLLHFSGSPLHHRSMVITNERPQQTVRKNIAVASLFGAHFDVYMAVVWTLGRVMKEGRIQVYSNGPFRFDFQTVVESIGLFEGTLKDQGDFLPELREDESIDLVILGTCEIEQSEWSEALLKIWDERDASHKFKIVCIVHNIQDEAWQENIPHWSRRNAIRLLPISPHVGKSFREKFLLLSRDPSPVLRSAGYEYIPIDAHIPLLDIPHIPSLPERALSNVAIQGSFERVRRDYTNVFAELVQSVSAEPQLWGYTRSADGASIIEDESHETPPFKLHLVGSGSIDIPKELQNIVVFHTDLSYPDFYRLMSGMDICMPAFVLSQYINYYKYQASSTIGMCTEVNLPILAVHALREAYTYIDNDAVTVTRPAVMSEIQAIKALRSGNASAFLESDPSWSGVTMGSNPRVKEDVDRMMREGWMRPKEGFDACKQRAWGENERVMRSILQWA
ncbi:hypothetical protein BKA70DRAFT_1510095 [Coprinopsis sp. MPI-PUGE-AT-0042]|nr:hypothetical protein BKA70DRAFT_1510095 [Coprinopsis sp. MPI-PUGE-AT-0042]